MTSTMIAPPCPVAWCHESGHHQPDVDDVREHNYVTSGKLPTSRGGGGWAVVEAVAFETPSGVELTVEIADDPVLHDWAEVERVIAALREAATLAFGKATR